jgi:hypothetical protein
MAAADNLGPQFGRLFHGSVHQIPIGDIVKPNNSWGQPDSMAYAHATDNLLLARQYGHLIYMVEPMDNDETLKVHNLGEGYGNHVYSQKGFKVSTPPMDLSEYK